MSWQPPTASGTVPAVPPQVYPLTYGQDQHLSLLRARPQLRTSLFAAYRLVGDLDVAAFGQAVLDVVRAHEALRLAVTEQPDGSLCQYVREPPDAPRVLRAHAVRAHSREQFDRYAAALLRRHALEQWHLDREYPFRFTLLRFSATEHVFLAAFPHVSFDGHSWDIVLRRLWASYRRGGSRPSADPDVPGGTNSFVATAQRHRDRFGRRAQTVNRSYWQRRIAAAPPMFQLHPELRSAGVPTPTTPARLELDAQSSARLRAMCARRGCTPFQWLLAAFGSAVLTLTPQDRIMVHVPVDGRQRADHGVVGMFASGLPVLLDRTPDPTAMVDQVRAQVVAAVTHCQVEGEVLRGAEAALAEVWRRPEISGLGATYVRYGPEVHGFNRSELLVDRTLQNAVKRTARPAEIRVVEHPTSIHISILTGAPVPAQLSSRLLAHVTDNLRDAGVYYAPPGGEERCEPSPATPAGGPHSKFAALRAADGSVVMCVDTVAVAALIARHDAVRTARVHILPGAVGLAQLGADVTVGWPVPQAELERHCAAAAEPEHCLLAPVTFEFT